VPHLRRSQSDVQEVLNMKLDSRWKPQDVLALAVKSEIEAAALYTALLEKVSSLLLRRKLEFLIFEEKKHRSILERLYSQRFAGLPLNLPSTSFLPASLRVNPETLGVPQLFQTALQVEKYSEDFYKSAAKIIGDEAGRKMLEYLARVERSHYFLIKSEIDLLEKFPDSYKIEETDLGEDRIHVGP
jgi:rubrerythrin